MVLETETDKIAIYIYKALAHVDYTAHQTIQPGQDIFPIWNTST
jgi:hypothetical protein